MMKKPVICIYLSCLDNIVRVIKSRRFRGARHAARMVASANAYKLIVGKPDVGVCKRVCDNAK
jgi:hypothetical protein